MNTLVNILEQHRKALHLTDAAFSRRMGITRALWGSVKHGNSKPGMKVVRAAMQAFPELQLKISIYLSGFGGD